MAGNLLSMPLVTIYDANGVPISGGTLTFYRTTTTTAATVYTDGGLSAAADLAARTADAAGRLNPIYLSPGVIYKLVIKDALGSVIETIDPLNGGDGEGFGSANVLNYGAVGDGATDDTDAVRAAIDTGATDIVFPGGIAGRTFLVNERIDITNDGVTLRGIGKAVVKWATGTVFTGPMIYFNGGDEGTIRDLTFQGDEWVAFGDAIYPGTVVRVGSPTLSQTVGFRAINCRIRGGNVGLGIWHTTDIDVEGLTCIRQYTNGMFTSSGAIRVNVHKFFAREVAIGEGYKFGFHATAGTGSDLIQISSFRIKDCGRADPNTLLHQEGLDCYVSDWQRVQISDGMIIGCGNGGIEIKTQHTTHVGAVDLLEDITISNVRVEVNLGGAQTDTNQPSFVLSWADFLGSGQASPVVPGATKARRIIFENCQAKYDPANAGQMFLIGAYTDIQIINATCIGPHQFIRTDGSGGVDAKVRDIKVRGGKVRGGTFGVYHSNGGMIGLDLDGVDIECSDHPVVLSTGTLAAAVSGVRIRGGSRLVSTDTSGNKEAILLFHVADIDIGHCYIEAERVPIYAAATGSPANLGGRIHHNRILARTTASGTPGYGARLDAGTWYYHDNDLSGCPDDYFRGVVTLAGTPTIYAHNNLRGLKTAAPTLGGAIGDYWGHSDAAAGEFGRYDCTTAADTLATWKGGWPIAA